MVLGCRIFLTFCVVRSFAQGIILRYHTVREQKLQKQLEVRYPPSSQSLIRMLERQQVLESE